MVQQMLTKIDYAVLKQAYHQIYDWVRSDATTHHPHLLPILPPTLPDELPNEWLLPIPTTTSQQAPVEHIVKHDDDDDDEVDKTDDIMTNLNVDVTTTADNDHNKHDDDSGSQSLLLYKTLFCALFEIHIMEGILICPDTQREFPIKDGIPNMILHEDEL